MRTLWSPDGSKGVLTLIFLRKHSKCSCSEKSTNWSWPFTRAHEKYHDQVVTTVTCFKHPWSVRLYDDKAMKFLTIPEEQEAVRQLEASGALPQISRSNSADNAWLALAYTPR